MQPILSRAITKDEIQAFASDGVVCLRGVLDVDDVSVMEAPVERALRGPETADLGALTGTTGAPAFAAGVDHWRTDPDFDPAWQEGRVTLKFIDGPGQPLAPGEHGQLAPA